MPKTASLLIAKTNQILSSCQIRTCKSNFLKDFDGQWVLDSATQCETLINASKSDAFLLAEQKKFRTALYLHFVDTEKLTQVYSVLAIIDYYSLKSESEFSRTHRKLDCKHKKLAENWLGSRRSSPGLQIQTTVVGG
jgi:hypothetical protein